MAGQHQRLPERRRQALCVLEAAAHALEYHLTLRASNCVGQLGRAGVRPDDGGNAKVAQPAGELGVAVDDKNDRHQRMTRDDPFDLANLGRMR